MTVRGDGEWRREVPCRDIAKRERMVTVTINDDAKIVLTPPPGEAMVLAVSDVTGLRIALREAQIEALHRREIG